jgi:hypothetical protein
LKSEKLFCLQLPHHDEASNFRSLPRQRCEMLSFLNAFYVSEHGPYKPQMDDAATLAPIFSIFRGESQHQHANKVRFSYETAFFSSSIPLAVRK